MIQIFSSLKLGYTFSPLSYFDGFKIGPQILWDSFLLELEPNSPPLKGELDLMICF